MSPLLFAMASTTLIAPDPQLYPEVYLDGRDHWTLMDRKLMNRQLFEQIHDDRQAFRLGRDLGMLAVAGDAAVGGEVAPNRDDLSRFHGFYVLDAFVSLRPLDGVDANLNLTVFNPSASDGFRRSNEILAGFSLHLSRDLWDIAGAPLHIDFLALDLDLVTLGQGLLVEQIPLEGHMGTLGWKGFYLRETFGGRVFWDDDDLQSIALGALGGAVELQFVTWLQQPVLPVTREAAEANVLEVGQRIAANYFTLSGHYASFDPLRVSAEYGIRLRGTTLRHAGLLRLDYLQRSLWRFDVHVGYQARAYQRGFGPRDGLSTPLAIPNLPRREDVYATNSFEYFGISKFFDQWSHTAMAEVRLRLLEWLYAFGEAEYWLRISRDPRGGHKRVVFLNRGGRAPGIWQDVYYRGGLELHPWGEWPYRMNAYITNKRVVADESAAIPLPDRFQTNPVFVIEVEVFL